MLENRPKSYQGDAFIPFTKKTSSEYFYWTMMNDTIYAISDNKIYPSRFIDFGKYKSKYDEYIELSPGRRMNFLMYKDFYDQCLMNRFFETKDYLYIGYYLNKKYHAYILNKNSHDFLHYDNEHLNDDISYFDIHGKVPKILGTYNDYFVYVLYPHEYNSAKELGRFLNGFSKFKKSEVETMMYETANPIILLVKYKF